MTAPDSQVRLAEAPAASRSRTERLRRWWVWTCGAGLGLLLVPVLALFLTNRAPDAVFLGYWWSPIASVPTDTLTLGTLGLALLLATALALAVTTPLHGRRRARGVAGVALVAGLIALACVGVLVTASSKADTSGAAIRAVLLRQRPATEVSSQARRAFQLALGWPAPTAAGIRVLHRSSVPAGPWLVQTTEVLNQDLADEGSDVGVETLIDPATGDIEAAWFYGL